jgi:hypothetical protein
MNCDEKSIRDAVAASKTFDDPNVRRYYEAFEPLLAEIDRLRNDARDLRNVLLRNGFVPCDSPACNCGSWHARFGLPERMQEIKDALAEADHELSNANGNLTLNALKALVAERDELRRQLAEAEPKRPQTCLWSRSDDDTDVWETACGNAFTINEGGAPADNEMTFCCFCGRELKGEIGDSDDE